MNEKEFQVGKYLLETDGAGMIKITELHRIAGVKTLERGHEEQFAARVVELLIADFFERNRKKTYKPAPLQKWCHADLYDGRTPDTCVFDAGDICECVMALELLNYGKGRDDCQYWKPVK